MTDAPPEAGARPLDAKQIAELARQLTELLRLRTLPFGMKLFESAEEMAKIPGLRRPPQGRTFSTCQLVTQARIAGFTMGITHENVPGFSNCGGVIGLNEPSELYLSGRKFEGVWFENREAARKHQAEMPRVPPRYAGLCVSPLRSARLDPPDICLFYANPAQMILFINGLQWKTYKRFDFSITGESACANPENFDAELGLKIARQNAVAKIWPLMGYELRSKLSRQPVSDNDYRMQLKDIPITVIADFVDDNDAVKALLESVSK